MRSRIEIAALVGALILGVVFLGSFVAGLGPQRTTADLTANDPAPPPPEPPAERVRVEVLNGSGRSGLARAVTGQLREAGFDVVYFGNAASVADSSAVLARVPDDGPARRVAARLQIGRVGSEPDESLQLEATVILGKDWPR